jgi:hypothetical protein
LLIEDLIYLHAYTMKHIQTLILCIAMQVIVFSTHAQSPVGKNLHEIIALYGENFKRLTDAEGLHVLQYKKLVGKDTICDFIYLQGFTCVKEVSLRPVDQKQHYIDSLSRQYTNAGFNSWRDKDSSYITLATRDGYLDITSFSNAYYKKIAH